MNTEELLSYNLVPKLICHNTNADAVSLAINER